MFDKEHAATYLDNIRQKSELRIDKCNQIINSGLSNSIYSATSNVSFMKAVQERFIIAQVRDEIATGRGIIDICTAIESLLLGHALDNNRTYSELDDLNKSYRRTIAAVLLKQWFSGYIE